MPRLFIAIILTAVTVLGCNTRPAAKSVISTVKATDATRQMIGRWGAGGDAAIIFTLQNDNVAISGPPNDTWRIEIHDATIVDDSIHFVQKSYLLNGDDHPFNGVACNSIVTVVDEHSIRLKVSTAQSPELEADMLTRIE